MEANVGSGKSGYNIGGKSGGTSGSGDDGYKNGAGRPHSIGDNLANLKDNYDYRNGYFGKPSKPKKPHIRHIESDDPVATARDFYDKAARGGIEEPLPNGKGTRATMSDGTVITMRKVSSSDGSPAVDINISESDDNGGVKGQKIHFVKKEGK